LKEVGTLKAALISVGKPGQASAAAMQCLEEFGIYHDLQMTPQEAHHVTLCPQWKIVRIFISTHPPLQRNKHIQKQF